MTNTNTSLTGCRRIVEGLKEDFEAAERIEKAIRAIESSRFPEFEAWDAAEAEQLKNDLSRFEIPVKVDGLALTFDCDEARECVNDRFDPLDLTALTDGRGRLCARILFGCGSPTYGVKKDACSRPWKFFASRGGEDYEAPDYGGLIKDRFMDLMRARA